MAETTRAALLADAAADRIDALMPVPHRSDRCEAMTPIGRITWRPCTCRRRFGAALAGAVLAQLIALIAEAGDLDLDVVLAEVLREAGHA